MEELIKQIVEIYFKYGIKSVTMDDLARELSMSKKTLYQYFKDKDDVIRQVLLYYMTCQNQNMKLISDSEEKNAIDILFDVSKFLITQISRVHPSISFDLQKYYPALWLEVVENRRMHMMEKIKENILLGIKQGLYRSDFNIDIITFFYVLRIESSLELNSEIVDKFSFEDVFNTLFIYHVRGIANAKGIEYLENKIQSALH